MDVGPVREIYLRHQGVKRRAVSYQKDGNGRDPTMLLSWVRDFQ